VLKDRDLIVAFRRDYHLEETSWRRLFIFEWQLLDKVTSHAGFKDVNIKRLTEVTSAWNESLACLEDTGELLRTQAA